MTTPELAMRKLVCKLRFVMLIHISFMNSFAVSLNFFNNPLNQCIFLLGWKFHRTAKEPGEKHSVCQLPIPY